MSPRRDWARSGLAGVVVALLVVVALAGCGLPTDHSPRAISRRDLPGAIDGNPGVTTTTAGPESARVALYFIHDQRLTALFRDVADGSPRTVVEALLAGPTTQERARDVVSYIPENTRVLSIDFAPGGVLVIDLSSEMNDVSGSSARVAYGQLVFSATAVAGVSSVAFQTAGHAVEVPTDSGNKRVVVRADYNNPLKTGT